MRLAGAAQRLTIFVGESDRWHHHASTSEILHRAAEPEAPGAKPGRSGGSG